MRSRVTLLRHPVHPILVMFPVALFPLLVVFDGLAWYFGDVGMWAAGFWAALVAGAITAVAIVPGIVDLSAIPNASRAHRIATFHLIVGFTILAGFAVTIWARWPVSAAPRSPTLVLGIDAAGAVLVTLQGWLGGELVYKHHIGVDAPEEGGDPTRLEPGPGLHLPPP